jgi:cation:H+ antiporter
MLINFLILITGLSLLVLGAEYFVSNTAKLGAKLKLNDMFLGITIVALGTSIPEVFVSISSILNDSPELAVGNSIGSNIANIGLIFGVSCFFLSKSILDINLRDIFLLILSVLISGYVIFDFSISKSDSFILVCFLVLFILHLLRQKTEEMKEEEENGVGKNIFFILLSLIILLSGSELTVNGGKNLAIALGVSNTVIGLTLVAIGTSLPELAASFSALRRKKGNMVIGNIIGSNILNLVLIFPIIGFATTVLLDSKIFERDFLLMSLFTAIFVIFITFGENQNRIKKLIYPFLGIGLIAWTFYYQTSLFFT